jgi:LuxR family maltose regulon positive regulatory protein
VHVPARLAAALRRALDADVVEVQAPAGFGKTAMLAQTLLDNAVEPVWYACSDEDRSADRLLRGLVDALGLLHTASGQTALAALKAGDQRQSFRPVLRPIVDELAAASPAPLLVIDDADTVLAEPATVRMLDELVAMLHGTMGVVLISRTELPLACLPRLRIDGRGVQITAADLLLREDEIADCAEATYGVRTTAEHAARLYRLSAGWPIALRLALRLPDDAGRAPTAGSIALSPDARAALFSYLAAEVLKGVDNRMLTFLRRTAVLEVLEPAICGAVGDEPHPAELIQSLAAAGLPVMKTGWSAYRCHNLLRDYFLAKLTPQELRDAHAGAAGAYAAAGDYGTALAQLVAAGAVEAALPLVAEHGSELFRGGRGRQLLNVVKRAPRDALDRWYRAEYWAAVAASRMFDWDWATAALERVHRVASEAGDDATARDALRALAYMLNVWGRFGPAAEAGERLIAAFPTREVAARAAAALGHLVPGMTGSGQFRAAVEMIHERLPELAAEPRADPDAEALARAVAAVTLARDGDFALARAQLSLADRLVPACTDDVVRTFVPWTRAMTGFLASDPESAEASALEAEGRALQVGDLQRLLECRALRAAVAVVRGNLTEADDGFADVEELRAGITNFWVTILTLLSRPRQSLLRGDAAGALRAAEANHALALGVGEAWFVCFSRLEVIYLRLLSGDPATAREHARAACDEARALASDLLTYGAGLMLAACGGADAPAAMSAALRVASARDYRFLMPYAVRLPALEAALWRALDGPDHARAGVLLAAAGQRALRTFDATSPALPEPVLRRAVEVLAEFGAEARPSLRRLVSSPAATVAEAARAALSRLDIANPHGLSAREREVLTLLARGLRTKDIAGELVLTPATVSTHIQRIMHKTGTTSRAELVALALREEPASSS